MYLSYVHWGKTGKLKNGLKKIKTRVGFNIASFMKKNSNRDGGSTALYAAFTVDTLDMVYIVDMVYTVEMVYTVDTVDTANTVDTLDSVDTVDTVDMVIPDICHGRKGRRPCKLFLPSVNFYRFNAKNWQLLRILP